MDKPVISPYRRVITALRGGHAGKIPFTVYDIMIPRCTEERQLRNRGMCLVKLMTSYKIHYPDVEIKSIQYTGEDGQNLIRTMYTTPRGDLSTLSRVSGFVNDWRLEHMFKTPDDYKALLFLMRNAVVVPDYAAAARTVEESGEDYIVRDQIGLLGLEPLQTLISSIIMSPQDFCIEWMENRDELLKLYDAIAEVNRKIYKVVADGPLEIANYGGNVIPQIIGADTFRKYYLQHYNEAAEILHGKGKLIGCHFDADNTTIMDDIGKTDLDYIEAYDPGISPPVGEARKKWPDKVLWINWPSSWHLEPPDVVRAKTIELIEDAGAEDGFIIGITEDVPRERMLQNYCAIMDGIEASSSSNCVWEQERGRPSL